MKCKDCTERHVGCHSTCEAYKDFRKELDSRQKPVYCRASWEAKTKNWRDSSTAWKTLFNKKAKQYGL